jgi:hypothetical protein
MEKFLNSYLTKNLYLLEKSTNMTYFKHQMKGEMIKLKKVIFLRNFRKDIYSECYHLFYLKIIIKHKCNKQNELVLLNPITLFRQE